MCAERTKSGGKNMDRKSSDKILELAGRDDNGREIEWVLKKHGPQGHDVNEMVRRTLQGDDLNGNNNRPVAKKKPATTRHPKPRINGREDLDVTVAREVTRKMIYGNDGNSVNRRQDTNKQSSGADDHAGMAMRMELTEEQVADMAMRTELTEEQLRQALSVEKPEKKENPLTNKR